jgi:Bacterial regulatory protein, Fis family
MRMAATYEIGGLWFQVPKPLTFYAHVRAALLNALAYTGGDQHRAAGLLGITDRVMNYKMAQFDIPRNRGLRAGERPRRHQKAHVHDDDAEDDTRKAA